MYKQSKYFEIKDLLIHKYNPERIGINMIIINKTDSPDTSIVNKIYDIMENDKSNSKIFTNKGNIYVNFYIKNIFFIKRTIRKKIKKILYNLIIFSEELNELEKIENDLKNEFLHDNYN